MTKLDIDIYTRIIRNPNEINTKSIYEYAFLLNVSASKLTKALQKIGINGFKELKFSINYIDMYSNIESSSNIVVIVIKLNKYLKERINDLESGKIDYNSLEIMLSMFKKGIENCLESKMQDKYNQKLLNVLNLVSFISIFESHSYYIKVNKKLKEEFEFLSCIDLMLIAV